MVDFLAFPILQPKLTQNKELRLQKLRPFFEKPLNIDLFLKVKIKKNEVEKKIVFFLNILGNSGQF